MLKKICTILILLITLLPHAAHAYSRDFKYIEIFDPKQNKVVKVLQLDSKLDKIFEAYLLNNSDGLYGGGSDPFTDDGYAIKAPLSHPVVLNTKYIRASCEEFFIIIPEKKPPFLLVFDDKKTALCLPFKDSVQQLSKELNFKLPDWRKNTD